MAADPAADEVMRLSAEILISMREAGVERTGLTYACLLEILAGIAHRGGAVGVEDCEVVNTSHSIFRRVGSQRTQLRKIARTPALNPKPLP